MNRLRKEENRRVVVTGLGVISSIGIGWEEFWKSLMSGKSGISRITAFDTSKYDRHYAGEVKNFNPERFIDKQKIPKIGRASQMAIAATKLALKDANLTLNNLVKSKMGVCIGTTTGEIGILEELDNSKCSKKRTSFHSDSVPIFPSSSLSSNVALELKLKGYNCVFATACAAGNYAVSRAFDLIRSSKTDFAFAGGADGFSRIVFTGFARAYVVAPRKCQPFDKDRKGMIPGEGAGILLLESFESAKKRNAKIYAEILGYGMSCDAWHMANPSVKGITKAIKRSLENSQVPITDIDYINAHGTGTPENDKAECKAIKKVFGKRANNIPVSSIKSMLGHTLGAASALEAIACCLVIKNNEIPPTINLEEKDPDCDIDCVPNKGRKHKVKTALNNSSGFGGNNASLILRKFL